MKFLHSVFLGFILSAAASLTSCTDDKDVAPVAGQMTLQLEHVAGSAPLTLNGTAPYKTAAGDDFTVTTFRYYISNIKLGKADGTEFVQPESYYLIDEAKADSKIFTIPNVPAGDYTKLTFTIGVDSARNVAGAQTGALAPSDMFWKWDSGYIYTKLEGRSAQSPSGGILFHIGGFKKPNNTIRTVSPALGSSSIRVRNGSTPTVHLKADVLKMFTGPNTVRFATLSSTMGGPDAMLIADNQAAGMFTVAHIQSN
ncbi:hypothetical protein LGH70_09680 [Hymenobacter sp. BT635]|uniref:Copper-binding protein MbnP-like domain-containing protein n=1 Tax=Hymenobacter nitidus TaxID=2880929 RepID=A0ABS8AC32_9BACT|nr:MbnP family protein [Hymenobacter nitidus]MCB2377851.1 hypothetical protein [Hymenobacter nitidus]